MNNWLRPRPTDGSRPSALATACVQNSLNCTATQPLINGTVT